MTPDAIAPPQIMIVEDDEIVREIMAAHLRRHGLDPIETSDCASALKVCSERNLDLVIMDVGLPDGSGFELAHALRRRRDCAVIFATSLDDVENRIRGLEGDGDDYIVKPTDGRELLARVHAVLRRHRRPATGEAAIQTVLEFAGWTLDLVRRELADPRGHLVPLTRAEFDLFAALVQARGLALSRDYLVEVTTSAQAPSKSRTIDVMVSRIRRKLVQGSRPLPQIVTAQGEGYRFKSPSP